MRGWLISRCLLLVWLAALASLLGLAGVFDWRLELFSHFLPFYIPPVLAGLWLERVRWRRVVLGTVLMVQLGWLYAAFGWPERESVDLPGMPLRLFAFNGYVHNPDRVSALAWLRERKPDVLLLTEATPAWLADAEMLRREMPHSCARGDDGPFGVALLSRQPLRLCEVIAPRAGDGFPYVRAELANGLVLYGIHPPPPLSAELAAARDAMLVELARRIATETAPVLVVGDMNITPFSPVYQSFRRRARLQEAGFPFAPTWGPPGWPAVLPLDRVLVRGVEGRVSVGPALGSDHRVLILQLP